MGDEQRHQPRPPHQTTLERRDRLHIHPMVRPRVVLARQPRLPQVGRRGHPRRGLSTGGLPPPLHKAPRRG